MKALRAFFLVIAFLNFRGAAFSLQANTPEGALEELVTADKIETFARHMPVQVEEAINKLGAKEKEELSKKLLVPNLASQQDLILGKAEDGVTWEVRNVKGELEGSIKLKNSFISGTDALVALAFHEKESVPNDESDQPGAKPPAHEQRQKDAPLILVSMRLQEGEWRVISFGPWEAKNLEAGDLLREIAHDVSGESAAATTLRVLNTSLITYVTIYREVGLPSSLGALAGANDAEASSEHAKMLDPSFMAVPLVKFGYKFQYTLLDPGTGKGHEGRYRITATPLEPGRSRSLFTDQSAVIRATAEGREASENDEPL
jgi:hypothetical protein